MDMFYSYIETEKKKRVHFHGFMLDVHKSESCFNLHRDWMQMLSVLRFCGPHSHQGANIQVSFIDEMLMHLKWWSCARRCEQFLMWVHHLCLQTCSHWLTSWAQRSVTIVAGRSSVHAVCIRALCCINIGTVLQFSFGFRCISNVSHVTRRKHVFVLSPQHLNIC